MIESRCGTQEQAIIDRAGALINSKTDYIGDGMEGWAVMTLMDENGYPTSSTMTISKADGIRWLSFLSTTTGAKADRIALSNKACICLASSEYHVSLTGTIEIITDPAIKRPLARYHHQVSRCHLPRPQLGGVSLHHRNIQPVLCFRRHRSKRQIN